jgi:hypothetical protein
MKGGRGKMKSRVCVYLRSFNSVVSGCRADWTGEVGGWHPRAAPQQAAGFERQQAAAVRVSDDSGGTGERRYGAVLRAIRTCLPLIEDDIILVEELAVGPRGTEAEDIKRERMSVLGNESFQIVIRI